MNTAAYYAKNLNRMKREIFPMDIECIQVDALRWALEVVRNNRSDPEREINDQICRIDSFSDVAP